MASASNAADQRPMPRQLCGTAPFLRSHLNYSTVRLGISLQARQFNREARPTVQMHQQVFATLPTNLVQSHSYQSATQSSNVNAACSLPF